MDLADSTQTRIKRAVVGSGVNLDKRGNIKQYPAVYETERRKSSWMAEWKSTKKILRATDTVGLQRDIAAHTGDMPIRACMYVAIILFGPKDLPSTGHNLNSTSSTALSHTQRSGFRWSSACQHCNK